jgi:hypothetical protein
LSWWQHLTKGLPWWQAVLVLLPLTLMTFMGGAVGGLIGAVAALACVALARCGWNAVLTAVSMVCVSALAFGGYFGIAALLLSPAAPSQAAANAQQFWSCAIADRSGSAAAPLTTPAASVPTSPAVAQPVRPTLPPGVQPVSAPVNSGTTSAHATEVVVRSSSGEDIGEGQSGDYVGAQVDFSGTVGEVLLAAGPYRIELESTGSNFACGTYVGATEFDDTRHVPGMTPVMTITGDGTGCTDNGTFTIYQMAANKKGILTQLNATFSHTCDSSPAPLVGVIRYNATTPTPVPSLPSSARPITPPSNSGTTSAHSDELSVLSAPGDFVGGGKPFDYAGPGIRVGDSLGTVNIAVAGWEVALSAPVGEQLVPGTYPGATAPGISVSDDGRGCNNDFGTFTIYQIATSAAGAVTQLNATFSQTCEWTTAPPLVGFVRFNATTPTPVPTLPPASHPSALTTSGTTSANADEFSFKSAADSTVGLGRSDDETGPAVALSGDLNTVQVTTAGLWTVQLVAPIGKHLAPGTYTAQPSYSSAAAELSVYGGGRDCTASYGTFRIYQIAANASGAVTQLNAIFSETCDSSFAPPLVGFVRFNATTPTPVPVLPAAAA